MKCLLLALLITSGLLVLLSGVQSADPVKESAAPPSAKPNKPPKPVKRPTEDPSKNSNLSPPENSKDPSETSDQKKKEHNAAEKNNDAGDDDKKEENTQTNNTRPKREEKKKPEKNKEDENEEEDKDKGDDDNDDAGDDKKDKKSKPKKKPKKNKEDENEEEDKDKGDDDNDDAGDDKKPKSKKKKPKKSKKDENEEEGDDDDDDAGDDEKPKSKKKKPKKSKKNENEEEGDDDDDRAKEINDSLSLVKKLKCKELKNIQKNIKGNKDEDEDDDDDDDYDDYYDLLTALLYGFRKRRDVSSDEVQVTSEGSLKLPPSFRYFRIGGQSSNIPTSIESPPTELTSKPSNGHLLDVLGLAVSEEGGKQPQVNLLKKSFQDGEDYKGIGDFTATTVSGNRDRNHEASDFKELVGILDSLKADGGKEFIGPLDYDDFREAYYRLGFVGPLGPGGFETTIPLSLSSEPSLPNIAISLSTEDLPPVPDLQTEPETTEAEVPYLPEGWLVR